MCCLIPGAGLRPLLFPRMLRRLAVWRTAAAAGRERPGARSADRCEAVNRQAERLLDDFGDSILRLAYSYLHSIEDAEEVLQDTLLQFLRTAPDLQSPAHEKAWLLRVTINACKDLLKSIFRSRTVSLDELVNQPAPLASDHHEVIEAVLSLPQKYRDVIYLHFYEGYSAPEIGRILGKNVNTVYTLLGRAKQQLREKLGGEGDA